MCFRLSRGPSFSRASTSLCGYVGLFRRFPGLTRLAAYLHNLSYAVAYKMYTFPYDVCSNIHQWRG